MVDKMDEKETLRQMGIVDPQYTYNLFAALAKEVCCVYTLSFYHSLTHSLTHSGRRNYSERKEKDDEPPSPPPQSILMRTIFLINNVFDHRIVYSIRIE